MTETNRISVARLIWLSFITSILLAVIEGLLTCLIKILVQAIYYGGNSGVVGVNPFVSIVQGCAFIFLMRLLLGFVLLNLAVWFFMALKKIKVSMPLICFVNGVSIFLMYCVWDWHFQIFHDLFYVKRFSDLFGWMQCGLIVGLLSPVILRRVTFPPNALPLILKTRHEHRKHERSDDV